MFFLPVFFGDSGLVSLERIYSYLEKLGYHSVEEGVGILIEDWPLQFIPVAESVQGRSRKLRLGESLSATIERPFSRPNTWRLNFFAREGLRTLSG